MDKFLALLPLLGWFYISIGVFVLFSWTLGRRFPIVKRLYYGAFGLLACVLIAQSLYAEIKLLPESNITLDDSFEQKMANESSDYYEDYYLGLRPAVTRQDTIYLPSSGTREYHYVRTFLYPAEVLAAPIPDTEALVVMNTADLKNLERLFEVVATSKNKSLVRVEGVRR